MKFDFIKIGDTHTYGHYEFADGSSDYSRLIEEFKNKGAMIVSACRGKFDDVADGNLDANKLDIILDELSEYRITVKDEDKNVVNFARKYDYYLEQWNEAKTRDLEKMLRDHQLGFRPSYGGFFENGNGHVSEISFVVPYRNVITKKEFYNLGIEICNKYNQDSVLFCLDTVNDGKPTYVTKDGSVDFDFTELHTSKEGDQYFTHTKKHNTGAKTFGNEEKPTDYNPNLPRQIRFDSAEQLADKICENHLRLTRQNNPLNSVYGEDGWSK